MDDKNKVVIKVNYKSKSALADKAGTQPNMNTEWNIKRIFIALLVFLIVGGGMIFWLMDAGKSKQNILNPQQQADKIISNIDNSGIAKIDNSEMEPEKVEPDKIELEKVESESEAAVQETGTDKDDKTNINVVNKPASNEIKQVEQPILTPHLVRALLTKAVNNKEPEGELSIPVIVSKDKAIGVFYFTELKDMKGQAVYHEWIFNGRTVFKRRIKILGKRWRASTRKLMSHKVLGDWLVRLTDNNGKVMNEISFQVKEL